MTPHSTLVAWGEVWKAQSRRRYTHPHIPVEKQMDSHDYSLGFLIPSLNSDFKTPNSSPPPPSDLKTELKSGEAGGPITD